MEDVVEALIAAFARLRGRRHPVIIPFIGHGTTERARIGARIVLGREAAAPPVLTRRPPAGDVPEVPSTPRRRRAVLRASLARFLTVEVPGAPVTIQRARAATCRSSPTRTATSTTTSQLPDVAPGWLEVGLSGPDGSSAVARVLVVDPAARIGLVSDVDDTILDTGLTRGLEFLRATLLTDVHERTPLPGAAALYRALRRARRRARGGRSSTSPPARGTCTRCCCSSCPCAGSRWARCCSPTGARRTPGCSGSARRRTRSGWSAGCSASTRS